MRKLVLAAALVLAASLGGCAGKLPTLDLNTSVTNNTLLGTEAAYGIALSGERAYKALPLCKTGTTPSITNICAKRSVIVRLQAADRKAVSAIDAANTFIKNYPTIDATDVIAAAQAAVTALKGILSSEGVQ